MTLVCRGTKKTKWMRRENPRNPSIVLLSFSFVVVLVVVVVNVAVVVAVVRFFVLR